MTLRATFEKLPVYWPPIRETTHFASVELVANIFSNLNRSRSVELPGCGDLMTLRNLWLRYAITTISRGLMRPRLSESLTDSSSKYSSHAWHSDLFKSCNHAVHVWWLLRFANTIYCNCNLSVGCVLHRNTILIRVRFTGYIMRPIVVKGFTFLSMRDSLISWPMIVPFPSDIIHGLFRKCSIPLKSTGKADSSQ